MPRVSQGGMMKRAFTAVVVSGLFVFAVPQAAFADHAADHGSGQEAGQPAASPEPDGAAEPEESPSEPEHARAGDRESEDREGDFLLF